MVDGRFAFKQFAFGVSDEFDSRDWCLLRTAVSQDWLNRSCSTLVQNRLATRFLTSSCMSALTIGELLVVESFVSDDRDEIDG
jgi:hypothetical protein